MQNFTEHSRTRLAFTLFPKKSPAQISNQSTEGSSLCTLVATPIIIKKEKGILLYYTGRTRGQPSKALIQNAAHHLKNIGRKKEDDNQ